MFTDYSFLFELTYVSRWDFIHNEDNLYMSYYADDKIYYVSDENQSYQKEVSNFLDALAFFAAKKKEIEAK